MYVRSCFQWLLLKIAVTCHTMASFPTMTSVTFRLMASSSGVEWCSVDQPSAVVQMACGPVELLRKRCALKCATNGCCLLYQFKANSLLCELFEYTTTNFSVVFSCTSQRTTMRAGQPVVAQRDKAVMESPDTKVDRSNGQCYVGPSYYIVSHLNQRVIDIEGGQGNPGDPIVMKTKQTGKKSQMWYFDAQGYMRSAKNDYVIDIIGPVSPSKPSLGIAQFNGANSNQQWKWVSGSNWLLNANLDQCFAVNNADTADGTSVVGYSCNSSSGQVWTLSPA